MITASTLTSLLVMASAILIPIVVKLILNRKKF